MEALRNMLSTIVSVVPKLLLFVVILVIGWLIAKLLRTVVDKLLDKVGFDRLADRGGLRRFLGSYDPSQFVAMLVFYAILLITLQLAFGVFGPNPVSAIIADIVGFLPQLFVAVVIVIIAAAIAKAVYDIVVRSLGGMSYGPWLARAAQVAILGLGIIAALNQIGVATTVTLPVLITILATVGAVIAIGVGGGLIAPMRERWERILTKGEREASNVRGQRQARSGERPEPAQPAYTGRGETAGLDPAHPRASAPPTAQQPAPEHPAPGHGTPGRTTPEQTAWPTTENR